MTYSMPEGGAVFIPLWYGGKQGALLQSPSNDAPLFSIALSGVALSRAGMELFEVVDLEPADAAYTEKLVTKINQLGGEFIPVVVLADVPAV